MKINQKPRSARSSSRASRCRIFMEKQKIVEITVRKGVENLPKGHFVGMNFLKKIHPKIMSAQKRFLMEEEFVLEITVRNGVDELHKNAICRETLFVKNASIRGLGGTGGSR